MSNRRRLPRPRPQNPATAYIAALDGARIPGGCDHCDAYQVVRAHAYGADLHTISVYHDNDCPWLAARQASRS
jgi:hypothetical protein